MFNVVYCARVVARRIRNVVSRIKQWFGARANVGGARRDIFEWRLQSGAKASPATDVLCKFDEPKRSRAGHSDPERVSVMTDKFE
jgi:hypothetical protein